MKNHLSADHKFLDDLNLQQRAAAEHIAGPLLVIAGAGTGKTKTLAARVAALIQGGNDPSAILLLTFTRRAAMEMLRRAGRAIGGDISGQVWGGTFHAVAHRLLRSYSQQLGLNTNFVVMDQGDAQDLLHLIRTDLGLHKSQARFPQKGTLLAIYSRCISTGEPLKQVLAERFPWCAATEADLKRIFQEYGQRKAERNLVDFDDLLLYWEQALDVDGVAQEVARRFRHVLVDEYQDTNPLQATVLRKLWGLMTAVHARAEQEATVPPVTACSIMVVGDDAQSIYSFRGATVENILQFPEQFAGTVTVTLEQNYRSVLPILDAANAVLRPARRQFTKTLWSERRSAQMPMLVTCSSEIEQSRYVADRILEHREEGIPLTRQAVLFRGGHNSDALEVELSRRNIPFVKWGGLKFLEAAHVKDLLAFLRVLENPRDDLSWMRILQLLDGVGPGRARQVVEWLPESSNPAKALLRWKAPAVAEGQVRALARLLSTLAAPEKAGSLPAQIDCIRKFYAPLFELRYENPEMRLRDLDQLELLCHHAQSRAAFLADLTLDPPSSTGALGGAPHRDEEYVVLSTIHSAKGCEWDVVYVIHAADGVIPSDMVEGEAELEEERRLLYVALTRARDRLYITFPLRYYHRKHVRGDGHSYAQLSRFLPPVVFSLFERQSFGAEPHAALDNPSPVPAAARVQERIRRLWE